MAFANEKPSDFVSPGILIASENSFAVMVLPRNENIAEPSEPIKTEQGSVI